MKRGNGQGAALAGVIGGTLIGVALSLIFFVLLQWLRQPDGSGAGLFEFTADQQSSLPVYIVLGAFWGFFTGKYAYLMIRRFFRMVLASLRLVVGGIVGLAFGLAVYIVFWLSTMSDVPGSESIGATLTNPDSPAKAFLISGFLSGVIAAAYLSGGRLLSRFLNRVVGASLGATAGLVIFVFAYVATVYPSLPRSRYYLAHFAEAVYSYSPGEFLFVGLGAAIGLLLAAHAWRFFGVSTLISLVAVVLGYLIYTSLVTLPRVPDEGRWFSQILFLLEICSLGMFIVYSFYTVDVAARKRWRRVPEGSPFSKYYLPKVAIQVPTYNEPFDIVAGTLDSLLKLDYPQSRMALLVIDDSTDPDCRRPLRDYCERHAIPYIHRENRHGFKAGALNHALEHTPDDAELIAVVDADYVVLPQFLRETVGYFVDPRMAWLQTPQDYRNRDQSYLTRQYYLADAYFYRTVLPSRNEENSIIFCGTMGLLRRSALEEVGGWAEDIVTEDSELSIRLIDHGYQSLYVNRPYGHGLIPPTFEGYKGQHYRWAFGSGQILRRHFRRILFGRFTARQSFDYLLGSFHWFDGLFILGLALALLYLGTADLLGFPVVSHHSNEILLLGLVPLFLLLDGFTRVHMVLRNALQLSFGDTLRILGMWFSVKFSNTRGAVKALLGIRIAFLRTPKGGEQRLARPAALRRAVRATPLESLLAILLAVCSVLVAIKASSSGVTDIAANMTRAFLAAWLGYYAIAFAAGPYYAYRSYTTFRDLTPQPLVAPVPVPVPHPHDA